MQTLHHHTSDNTCSFPVTVMPQFLVRLCYIWIITQGMCKVKDCSQQSDVVLVVYPEIMCKPLCGQNRQKTNTILSNFVIFQQVSMVSSHIYGSVLCRHNSIESFFFFDNCICEDREDLYPYMYQSETVSLQNKTTNISSPNSPQAPNRIVSKIPIQKP